MDDDWWGHSNNAVGLLSQKMAAKTISELQLVLMRSCLLTQQSHLLRPVRHSSSTSYAICKLYMACFILELRFAAFVTAAFVKMLWLTDSRVLFLNKSKRFPSATVCLNSSCQTWIINPTKVFNVFKHIERDF